MKTITSTKYQEPTFERGLVRVVPISGKGEPEYYEKCKFVDRAENQVWILNGLMKTRELIRSSQNQSQPN